MSQQKAAFREIRASFDNEFIIVYQAYNSNIAESAVKAQKLSASPLYRPGCWMMYRSGYSFKDSNQERILAIRMKHENFLKLLRTACLAGSPGARETTVVQWDPERGPRLERLNYRSIQIGISGSIRDRWIDEWIDSIEDVTEMARKMKRKLDEDPNISLEQLIDLGLVPKERIYAVEGIIEDKLEMYRRS